MLVERYIPGTEVAVEGLLTRGKLRILGVFDKPDPLEGPYFEETIYVMPSRLPDEMYDRVLDCATATVRALGLTHGPVHAEFRVNEQGPWVLEAAPRPIGGLCSRALRFGPERTLLEEVLVRHALGMPGSDLDREDGASGVMMIPVPKSGVLERVEGKNKPARRPASRTCKSRRACMTSSPRGRKDRATWDLFSREANRRPKPKRRFASRIAT